VVVAVEGGTVLDAGTLDAGTVVAALEEVAGWVVVGAKVASGAALLPQPLTTTAAPATIRQAGRKRAESNIWLILARRRPGTDLGLKSARTSCR
jgi:hypothetical protein